MAHTPHEPEMVMPLCHAALACLARHLQWRDMRGAPAGLEGGYWEVGDKVHGMWLSDCRLIGLLSVMRLTLSLAMR